MQYLVYVSAAARLMNDDELGEILSASRLSNLKNNITGMLVYSEGMFVQVLEGPYNVVVATYLEIQQDNRHKNIIKLAEGPIDKRLFTGLPMAFKKVSSVQISKISSFVDADNSVLADQYIHPAVTMLKTILESNSPGFI